MEIPFEMAEVVLGKNVILEALKATAIPDFMYSAALFAAANDIQNAHLKSNILGGNGTPEQAHQIQLNVLTNLTETIRKHLHSTFLTFKN